MFVYLPGSTISGDNILYTLVMPAVEAVTDVALVHTVLTRCGAAMIKANGEDSSFNGLEIGVILVSLR